MDAKYILCTKMQLQIQQKVWKLKIELRKARAEQTIRRRVWSEMSRNYR